MSNAWTRGRRKGGRPGFHYQQRPCAKCGTPYATNVLARHEERCPDDPLLQEANRVALEARRAKRRKTT